MKKMSAFSIAAGLVFAVGGLSAMAQELGVNFTVPSSFYAGNTKLPAGNYSLKQAPDESSFYVLQDTAGTHSVYLEARQSSISTKGNPRILFNKYGTMEYLEAVKTSNQTSVEFQEGTPEKIAAKKGSPQSHDIQAK
jgi:hypothetical protein